MFNKNAFVSLFGNATAISRTRPLAAALLLTGFVAADATYAAGVDRFVVTFKSGQAENALNAVIQAGGKVELDLSEINAVAVSLPTGAALALENNPAIEYVDVDADRSIMRESGVFATYAPGIPQTVPYCISMVQADGLTYNAASARKLCIIDSGYAMGHEDLPPSNVAGINLTHSGTWDSDENSHGTHVAGTTAALGNNGVGVVGVVSSGDMPIFIAKIFDASGTARSSVISRAVLACEDAGANVISMSLGGGNATKYEQKLYDGMMAKNILVVAAAGNDGNSAVSYPAGYAGVMSVAAVDMNGNAAPFSQYNMDVEIAAPGVNVLSTVPNGSQIAASLSVGSNSFNVHPMDGSPKMNVSGPLADFGLGDVVIRRGMTDKVCLIQRGAITFADKVKNCQSSGGIGAVIYNNQTGDLEGTLAGALTDIPSVGATQVDGQTMLAQLNETANLAVYPKTDLYAEYSGTSMATPHVSAVASLVWSYYPGCSAAQIRNALNQTALDRGYAGRDIFYGYGIVQAQNAISYLSVNACTAN